MCIGIPMQIQQLEEARALVQGRGQQRWVDIALVGPCAVDDWLLIFLDSAREHISAERAAEVNTVLNWVEQGMAGQPVHVDAHFDAFVLPSQMDVQHLQHLSGHKP